VLMAANTETQSPAGSSSDADEPKRLGKYVVQRRLGAGGMGTVFLALDSNLNRTVALKVLPKQRAANPTLVKRFTSEGQNAAKLEHDNIVKVFDTGEIDGHLYLALEYVDGVDVQDLVQKRGVVPVRGRGMRKCALLEPARVAYSGSARCSRVSDVRSAFTRAARSASSSIRRCTSATMSLLRTLSSCRGVTAMRPRSSFSCAATSATSVRR